MVKLAADGYILITNFISMPTSHFEILTRSLSQNYDSLFAIEDAGLFNQQIKGLNDNLRRMTTVDSWLAVTSTHPEATQLIGRLRSAVQRIIAALPKGYGHRDLPTEISIIRSGANCPQQAAHTDYDTDHADFG